MWSASSFHCDFSGSSITWLRILVHFPSSKITDFQSCTFVTVSLLHDKRFLTKLTVLSTISFPCDYGYSNLNERFLSPVSCSCMWQTERSPNRILIFVHQDSRTHSVSDVRGFSLCYFTVDKYLLHFDFHGEDLDSRIDQDEYVWFVR